VTRFAGRVENLPRASFVLLLILSCSGCKPPEESNVKAIVERSYRRATDRRSQFHRAHLQVPDRDRSYRLVIPQGTEEIDGAGQYIIPALIDVYVRVGDGVAARRLRRFPAGLLTAQTSPGQARRQSTNSGGAIYGPDRWVDAAGEEAALDEAASSRSCRASLQAGGRAATGHRRVEIHRHDRGSERSITPSYKMRDLR
jgi:hypothetical protein